MSSITQSSRRILFTGSSKSSEVLPPSLRNRYRKADKQEGPGNEGATQEKPARKQSLAQLDESSEWAKKNILALGLIILCPTGCETTDCSIDGGGIRGYSSLLILQHLMKECAKTELSDNPNFNSSEDSPWALDTKTIGPARSVVTPEVVELKCNPCHYFDFIAGTSTGG
jgi:Patatin-like phospholipase